MGGCGHSQGTPGAPRSPGGSPLPGGVGGGRAPPLVPASVGFWSQPSAAGESPRNRASVGPWNLGPAPPLPAVLPLSDDRRPEAQLSHPDRATAISEGFGERQGQDVFTSIAPAWEVRKCKAPKETRPQTPEQAAIQGSGCEQCGGHSQCGGTAHLSP